MQLSKNFTLSELVHSDTANARGIDNTPTDIKIVNNLIKLAKNVLQPIRDKYGKPIIITSGYRCLDLNKAVGGVSNSQHLLGLAADIDVGTVNDNKLLFNMIEEMIKNKEIVVDQLLDESHYKWIHISYNENNNRNQILHL